MKIYRKFGAEREIALSFENVRVYGCIEVISTLNEQL